MDTGSSTPITSNKMLESSAFKHRRIGRCASPPVWGCYELEINDSDSECVSQSDSDDDEAISVIISSEVDPVNIPLPPSPVPVVISMDPESSASLKLRDIVQGAAETILGDSLPADAALGEEPQPEQSEQQSQDNQDESCTDCGRQKVDKGKGREILTTPDSPQTPTSSSDQQCVPQTPSSRISRRAQRTQRRTPKYQPILTIRSSHGWIWNQDLFVPHYMKDRCKPLCRSLFNAQDGPASPHSTDISYPPEQQPSSTDGPGVEYDCVGITLTADDLAQVLPP